MRILYELAAKWSPSLATALVTVGVGAEHAEVVALGLAIGAVSVAEAVYNRFFGKV